ncbi:hypothetical protein ND856_18565 [Leptospira bandrabouensis]|uniref:hypothetical protein n=1 Tax=Leptospira bandrabouensis TaxID=2484903 RepID=UPI00223D087C|nr:hypothetical protein [Leptospira bandrabouensis]MCW7460173.1 hypothetical protein [Leptospira bandrabouensis]MCW7479310.1 hypothetical protein [Leptospira bandrabouensis]MCW7486992.1 hypothetical protein [Leptospira bandrabouensis]
MNVNFNNLRKNSMVAYNSLITYLENHTEKSNAPELKIAPREMEEFQEKLNDLRAFVGGVAAVYISGDPDFKDMSEEVELLIYGEQE